MADEIEKTYLGDGVYAHFDGYSVVLETHNGICATNTIILEPEVVIAYQKYLERLSEKLKNEKDARG